MSNVTRIYGFLQADLWSFSLFSLTNEEIVIIYQINVTKLISTHSFYDEANK